jgi:hypothetical protein
LSVALVLFLRVPVLAAFLCGLCAVTTTLCRLLVGCLTNPLLVLGRRPHGSVRAGVAKILLANEVHLRKCAALTKLPAEAGSWFRVGRLRHRHVINNDSSEELE